MKISKLIKSGVTLTILATAMSGIGMSSSASLIAASDAASAMPDQKDNKVLVGYWHNWLSQGNDGYQRGTSAAVNLNDTPKDYNVIDVSFMKSDGVNRIPTFKPYNVSDSEFRAQVGSLNAEGRSVLIALGGADAHIELVKGDATALKDEIIRLVEVYGFDGLDIDLEQSAITAGANQTEIPSALRMVKEHYAAKGQNFMITMAPEFPYLKPNGAYETYITSLEGYYDFINPQLYNQGGDGLWVDELNMWLTQNNDERKEDFLFYMADSFNSGTRGFLKIPAEKLVLGIPANVDGAATGFVKNPNAVFNTFSRLKAKGQNLKGLMTWSINWDAGKNANGQSYDNSFVKTYGPFIHNQTPPVPTEKGIVSGKVSGVSSTKVEVIDANTNAIVGTTITQNEAFKLEVQPGSYFLKATAPAGHEVVSGADATGKTTSFTVIKDQTVTKEISLKKAETRTAPTAPIGLVAEAVAETELTVKWNKNPESNIKYVIYQDGVTITSKNDPKVIVTGLTPGKSYTFTVKSQDTVTGLLSELSQGLTVKTLGGTNPAVNEWYQLKVYDQAGTRVTFEGNIYENKYWVQGNRPDVNDIAGLVSVWKLVDGPAVGQRVAWQNYLPYEGNTVVTHNGSTWKAKWYASVNDEPGKASVWERA